MGSQALGLLSPFSRQSERWRHREMVGDGVVGQRQGLLQYQEKV